MALTTIMITNHGDGFFRDIRYVATRFDQLKSRCLLVSKLLGDPILLSLTTVTPINRKTRQINHLVFWSMFYLWLIKPFLKPFLKRFLQRATDVVQKQQRNLQYEPNLMLSNDAGVQGKWYFQLKKSYGEAVKN